MVTSFCHLPLLTGCPRPQWHLAIGPGTLEMLQCLLQFLVITPPPRQGLYCRHSGMWWLFSLRWPSGIKREYEALFLHCPISTVLVNGQVWLTAGWAFSMSPDLQIPRSPGLCRAPQCGAVLGRSPRLGHLRPSAASPCPSSQQHRGWCLSGLRKGN